MGMFDNVIIEHDELNQLLKSEFGSNLGTWQTKSFDCTMSDFHIGNDGVFVVPSLLFSNISDYLPLDGGLYQYCGTKQIIACNLYDDGSTPKALGELVEIVISIIDGKVANYEIV